MASDEKSLFSFTVVGPLNQKNLLAVARQAVRFARTQQSFERFLVYVQVRNERHPLYHFSKEITVALTGTEGEISADEVLTGTLAFVAENEIRRITEKKAHDEANARSTPGHKSYQPSRILSTNSCVVAIGKQSFCGAIARFHLEDIPKHHGKLIETLDSLLSLIPLSRSIKFSAYNTLFISIRPDKRNHYLYNMNWLAEKILPPRQKEYSSLEELFANHSTFGKSEE